MNVKGEKKRAREDGKAQKLKEDLLGKKTGILDSKASRGIQKKK